jgi:exodeoxyribonuclease V alpha subunit
MTVHLSARLAWHMEGWNGHVCRDPASNTFCVGHYSYPGDQIRVSRNLDWEVANAGASCSRTDGLPPCVYSINAFGKDTIGGYADPPDWYPANERVTWDLMPSTVCIWPFEQMYRQEAENRGSGQRYNYDQRLAYATEYFDQIEESRSLVFYYSNYSNPFSEDDSQRYVIVGVSRVKSVGKVRNYTDMTPEDRKRYGGGFVWGLDLTSHYPNEGLRLPYHAYLDRPDVVERFIVVPPNARYFKYATRQFGDDDALEIVEAMIKSVSTLVQIGDTSERWGARLDWLHSVVGELWTERGLFPGLPHVLDHLGIPKAIAFFKASTDAGAEIEAKDAIFAFLAGENAKAYELGLSEAEARSVRRRWALLEDDERVLIRDALVRFAVTKDQIGKVLDQGRASFGITASSAELRENPYELAEQFVGENADDTISFSKIDHGMLPAPDLGGDALADVDDWRRLRALCVDRLKADQSDLFVSARQLIHEVNHRLSFYPEWKRHQFTERYLEVDRESLQPALHLRTEASALWVYLRDAFDDERLIENTLRSLATRTNIVFRTPVTTAHWNEFLRDPNTPLASSAGDDYARAVASQAEACSHLFPLPLCVLAGEAGTGKTTVVGALLQAIERTEGAGASFQLLAPTGKAAERLRERTGRRGQTATVHSFLAKRGWLNDNMTFKRTGGQREQAITTYIIDESSMLSLELMAALFRAINWTSVQRLILVGDPSQLPPIGRGRIFADTIDWLRSLGAVGELSINVRQMENRALGRGTAILELADAYVRRRPAVESGTDDESADAEKILKRVQEGGDVDKDLRVAYWRGGEDLQTKLIDLFVGDVAADIGDAADHDWRFWRTAFDENKRPELYQVLTPYRGEEFGTESLNAAFQELVQGRPPGEMRIIDRSGIALNDKVIQIKNRPPSNPIWAWAWSTRKNEQVEVYNGELGFANPHSFDAKKTSWAGFRPIRCQVSFSSKPDYAVGYGRDLGKRPDGKWLRREDIDENLELAYAVSIHKAQGSEFDHVYFVVPKHKQTLLSRELFYTGLTRAARHCTLLIEEDISPLLSMRRLERSRLLRINASLFSFRPVPDDLRTLGGWYEEGRIHSTLTEYMVRSKSEVIIANLLFDREISFQYETPLFAPDGTFYLPDFTIRWHGQDWYWEHLGRLEDEDYRNHWETKQAWYDAHFPGRLVTTVDSGDLTKDAAELINSHFTA